MAEDAEAEQSGESREEKEGVEFKITRVEGRRKFVSPAAIFRIMPGHGKLFDYNEPPLPLCKFPVPRKQLGTGNLQRGSVHRPRDNFPDANSPSPSVITLFARMEISSILDFIARSLAYIPVGSIGKFNFQERAESELSLIHISEPTRPY